MSAKHGPTLERRLNTKLLRQGDERSDKCDRPLAATPRKSHRLTPMKTRVFVTLKAGVLDPQGKAIHHALEGLGFTGVNDVRQGKLIELDLADGTSDADIEAMCNKLLANTVIENFRIEPISS
jgi:phosphoribosylformylglycinamidine synthase PurS subunit